MPGSRDGTHASHSRSPLGQPVVGRPRRSRSRSRGPAGSQDDVTKQVHSRYRAGSGDPIPQVPRIPNKYQSHNLSAVSATASERSQGDNAELDLIPAPHTHYLPGCSIGQPKEVQIISNAMMKAYVAMRGNWLGDEDGKDDPLFKWIQQRGESAKGSKPVNSNRDIARMLEMVDKALESANRGGDSPRDCIFELQRPNYGHIKPPQNMDLSTHEFTDSCTDFEWEEDPDDEEAGVRDGRISPCTFLQWSKGCVLWNGDREEHKAPLEVTASFQRMRPPTPKEGMVPEPPRRRAHTFSGRMEAQFDPETGEELTPAYSVPTSPSIVFTPPGVEVTGPLPPDFCAQYSRMAPLAERAHRHHVYGAKSVILANSSDSGIKTVTSTEVNAAVSKYMPEIDCHGRSEVHELLRRQWQATLQTEIVEDELHQVTQHQSQEIRQLQYDLYQMNRLMPALQLWREEKDEKERKRREEEAREEKRKERRVREIRARVANHVLEVQCRLDRAWDKCYMTRAQTEKNAARIAALRQEIQSACASVGVRDPGHAISVLMNVVDGGDDDDDDEVENGVEEGAGSVAAGAGSGDSGDGGFANYATEFDRTYHTNGNNYYNYGAAQAPPTPAQFYMPPAFGGSYIPLPPPPNVQLEQQHGGGVVHNYNGDYGRGGHITAQPQTPYLYNGEQEFEDWMDAWQRELAAKNEQQKLLEQQDKMSEQQQDNNIKNNGDDQGSHDGGDSGVSGLGKEEYPRRHHPGSGMYHQQQQHAGHRYDQGYHHHGYSYGGAQYYHHYNAV